MLLSAVSFTAGSVRSLSEAQKTFFFNLYCCEYKVLFMVKILETLGNPQAFP